MIKGTIILLTYYFKAEDAEHHMLRHIVNCYSPVYLPWDMYLADPLREIFSEVIVYDYLRRRAEIGIEAMNREILELARTERAGYVLWTSYYYDVYESTLDALHKQGVTVVGWFFDDEWRFDSYSSHWARHLDYCITNSAEAVPKYTALGARAIHIIPNTGIGVKFEEMNIQKKYDVSFVGTVRFADRRQYMAGMRQRGVHVQVFGDGSSGYLSFEDMISVFKSSKINLNFSKAGAYPYPRQIKGRVFQVCLAGGFMLTEYAPGIEHYFQVDKEIVCFEGEDEMTQKIDYYLKHDGERRAIARAGWERANKEHTSSAIVSKVFRQIEKETGFPDFIRFPCQEEESLPPRTVLPSSASQYHLYWGRALLRESYDSGLWRESFLLSEKLSNSLIHGLARYYLFIGSLPSLLRFPLFVAPNIMLRACKWIFSYLRRVPFLHKGLQGLAKRLA